MKNLYTQMVDSENQKSHPFGIAEKRFNWINNYSNGNDLHNHKKIFRKNKDNLEGGIGRYLTRIQLENEKQRQKEQETEQNLLKNKISKNRAHKYLNLNSQRVIYPEKDTEMKKANKKRTYGSQEKNLLHTTGGRITSLLDKTPLHFKNRGKKMLNNSVDYGRKRDTNLFSDDFLNDKEYNRIPGVDRKHIIPKVNIETQPLDEFSMGRKHFYKHKNKSLIY
jgi:hypothetical protein